MCVYSVTQSVWLFVAPWTVAHQAPLSMGFSRQTGVGCHFLFLGILTTQGFNLCLLYLLSWWADSLPSEPTEGKLEKFQMWKLKKKPPQNNQLVKIKKKSQKGNKKYLETNENGNKPYQNLWDTVKAVLRGKYTAINSYIKKKRSQTSNFTIKISRKRRIT